MPVPFLTAQTVVMSFILVAVMVLGGIALVAAVVLYVSSKKYAVAEDPRLAEIAALLPGANCGGCGFPGCSAMAGALVSGADKGSIAGLTCPAGGSTVASQVAEALGVSAADAEPMIAVMRCGGSCESRQKTTVYVGMRTCAAMNACGAGETGCGFGCLGCGDCVAACQFGGISVNPETGLPTIDEETCTGCGSCAKACPRHIIEIRKRGSKNRRVYVDCVNKDRGPVAIKICKSACIACGKCEKECSFGAITIADNLSYIDPDKCRMCRKCEKVCPTHAITSVNFPAPKAAAPANN